MADAPGPDASKRAAIAALIDEEIGLLRRMKSVFTPEFFAAGERPDGYRSDVEPNWLPVDAVAELRAVVTRIRALDPKLAAEHEDMVAKMEAHVQSQVSEETACRATPKCMADRLGPEICELLEARAATVAELKREKSNPSGVVDLRRLHELGESIQIIDAQIKASKATYLKSVKKPFADAQCQHNAQKP